MGLVGTASVSNNTAVAVEGINGAPNGGFGLLGAGGGSGVAAVGGAPNGDTADPALQVLSGFGADTVGVFNQDTSSALETFEVKAITADSKLCKAAGETPPCNAGGDVYITGDVHVKGALYATKSGSRPYLVARTTGGGAVTFYGTASRRSRLEDDGEAQLQSGQAYVALDRDFASTIDLRTPYVVFITPEGDRSIYVSARTPQGFFVREVGGGRSSVPFAYRIVANAAPAAESDGNFPVIRGGMLDPKLGLRSAQRMAQRNAAMAAELANRQQARRALSLQRSL